MTGQGTLCYFSRWDKLRKNLNFCPEKQPENGGTNPGPPPQHGERGRAHRVWGSVLQKTPSYTPKVRPGLSPTSHGTRG